MAQRTSREDPPRPGQATNTTVAAVSTPLCLARPMSTFFARQQQVAALDPRIGGLLASAGLYNLKALIKAIRACKTLADERSLIQKESAAIRAAFRDEDSWARHNNIAKLLYIYMLGYPAHFGQIECLKLVASPRFTDKRLGYLGIMLLLDENTEVLTLLTNGLKNDLNHSNMYIVGLALCTFGDIASEEMSRDLSHEIEKLMGSSNAYLRRKAALCALRVVRKVPDLLDHFVTRTRTLLGDKNHGALLCAVTLALELVAADETGECLATFRASVPQLVRTLKNLVTTGYSPEHDVNGITDPFLQVQILRLLRVLGQGDATTSERINDILAQVATNTEASKNVGNAILYETVRTVLDIEAENGLRVMAINILGKFLSNRDNNIRYVALNTLNKVVSIDTNAVQRHRSTVLDCLRDGDISIRRRALELTYALITASNVRVLARELLSFLEVADNEFKTTLTLQVWIAGVRFAPSARWHLDTALRMLVLAGAYVREDVLSGMLRLIAEHTELQSYAVKKLFAALYRDFSQDALTVAAVWAVGEYGDLLLVPLTGGEPQDRDDPDLTRQVTGTMAVDLLATLLGSSYANEKVRQFALVALAKLSVRLPEGSSTEAERIEALLAQYRATVELDVQQRAVELNALLHLPQHDVTTAVLESMPLPEPRRDPLTDLAPAPAAASAPRTMAKESNLLDLLGGDSAPTTSAAAPTAETQSTQDLLLDIFGSGPAAPPAPAATPAAQSNTKDDLLSLFGPGPAAPATAPIPAAPPAAPTGGDALDLLGLGGAMSSPPPSAAPAATPKPAPTPAALPSASEAIDYTAFDADGLGITLTPRVDAGKKAVVIAARFTNTGGELEGLAFQAAVPRSQKLQMQPLSSTALVPGGEATQLMRVLTPGGGSIKLRLRISFIRFGEQKQHQVDFAGFPADLLA